jgi:uncharacterized glyoxalase superfamily protein PhnB
MSIHPALRCADPPAALGVRTAAPGFRTGATGVDDAGAVQHAELRFGDPASAVLVGRRVPGADDARATGRAVTHLVAPDPDARHDTAVAAGAEVVTGPTDQPCGSRGFAVADPEGNPWCAGTYRPVP